MKAVILLTDHMREKMPAGVVVNISWGNVTCLGENGNWTTSGEHCYVEADEEVFKQWLHECKEFIIGKGSPMMQTFQRLVKE